MQISALQARGRMAENDEFDELRRRRDDLKSLDSTPLRIATNVVTSKTKCYGKYMTAFFGKCAILCVLTRTYMNARAFVTTDRRIAVHRELSTFATSVLTLGIYYSIIATLQRRGAMSF